MHDPESSRHELKGLEAQLAALVPRDRLDRDQLMYTAGRRAGARRLRVANRLLATTSLALSAVLAFVVALPGFSGEPKMPLEPSAVTQSAVAESGAAEVQRDGVTRDSVAAVDGPTYFRLRQRLEHGFDERARQPSRPQSAANHTLDVSPPSDARSLLNRYLNKLPDRL